MEIILNRARANLRQRLAAAEHLNLSEIEQIRSLRTSVIPEGITLRDDELERLRVLAIYSQVDLRAALRIASHRRFLGPAIALLKKLTWPFLYIHLKGSFEGMKQFNAAVLQSLAAQMVEMHRLRELLIRSQQLQAQKDEMRTIS